MLVKNLRDLLSKHIANVPVTVRVGDKDYDIADLEAQLSMEHDHEESVTLILTEQPND